MSQSLHASAGSGVSFFVDISRNGRSSRPQPQPKRRQSLNGDPEPIIALITRAREHLNSAMGGPTLTKAEVRRKRAAVGKIETLLSEEEYRLRRGEEPSNGNVVDVVLCGGADQSIPGEGSNKAHKNPLDEEAKQRPLSAYQQQRHGSIGAPGGGNKVRVHEGSLLH